MKKRVLLTWFFASFTVHAATILVTDASGLSVDGIIHWEDVAPDFPFPSTISPTFDIGVTGVPGLTAAVTKDGPGLLYVAVQGAGFSGNFGAGDVVLTTGGVQSGPIVLDFNSPVRGAGAQIQASYYGSFEGEVTAYDAANALLGSFRLAGVSNANGDGSAIFIGILSNSTDISRVVFNVPVASTNAERFAIGATLVQVDAAEVPEAGSLAMLGVGLVFVGVIRRAGGLGGRPASCRSASESDLRR